MRRAGVTLIELVVALTIASALLAAGYAALTTALDRREAAIALLEADLEALALRSSLRGWLEGTVIAAENSAPVFTGADGEAEKNADDQLSFVTSAETPLGAGLATVRLYVDRDPVTVEQGLVAEFAAWLGAGRMRLELRPDVQGMDVRYRSRLLSGRDWHPSWISSSVLPAGVELTLHGGAGLHEILRPPLVVALAGGR